MKSRIHIVFMLPCSSQKRTRKRSVSNTQGISTFLNILLEPSEVCCPLIRVLAYDLCGEPCIGCWPWLGCCPLICMLAPWFVCPWLGCWPAGYCSFMAGMGTDPSRQGWVLTCMTGMVLTHHDMDGYWPFMTGMGTDPSWQSGALTLHDKDGYWPLRKGMVTDPSWQGWVLIFHDKDGHWPFMTGMGTDHSWQGWVLPLRDRVGHWPFMTRMGTDR